MNASTIEGIWVPNLTMVIGAPTSVLKFLVHQGFRYRSEEPKER